jgi:hypothetical protein
MEAGKIWFLIGSSAALTSEGAGGSWIDGMQSQKGPGRFLYPGHLAIASGKASKALLSSPHLKPSIPQE